MTGIDPDKGHALTWLLGVSQLVCWGISYYLIGVFGETMAADLGWPRTSVHAGFSLALLVMGLSSAWTGRLIDTHGGRGVMMSGSTLMGAGCVLLALTQGPVLFALSWLVLGLAMRLTLYDAAFATLVHLRGAKARRPIAQITLLGGLASTVFWPFGHALDLWLGWRGAVGIYAVIAFAMVGLHAAIPLRARPTAAFTEPVDAGSPGGSPAPSGACQSAPPAPRATPGRDMQRIDALLFATIFALASFLNAAMSAHMIGLLVGVGVSASAAVWVSALRGVGQSLARLSEVLFGARLSPLRLNFGASLLLASGFLIGPAGFWTLPAALGFAFLYGAGNGLLTITRGTVPLVLFSGSGYGALAGRLLAPSFYLAASAPLLFAWIMDGGGERAALWTSGVLGALIVVASGLLAFRTRTSG